MTDSDTKSRKRLSTDTDKIKLSPHDIWVSADEIQIEMWTEWADQMNVTRSEFVRMAASAGIKAMQLPEKGNSYDESSISYRREILDAVEAGADDADEVIQRVLDQKTEEIRDTVGNEINELLATGQLNYDAHEGLQKPGDRE